MFRWFFGNLHFTNSIAQKQFLSSGISPSQIARHATNSHRPRGATAIRLRRNEHCPIHKSISCCGPRTQTRIIGLGLQEIEDPHHPRGYRELRSPAEMRKLSNRKIIGQNRKCAICHEEFTAYNDIVPDHRDPKGMEEPGETITRRISKQHTGGAMEKKDRSEWMTDGRSADRSLKASTNPIAIRMPCASCVHDFK